MHYNAPIVKACAAELHDAAVCGGVASHGKGEVLHCLQVERQIKIIRTNSHNRRARRHHFYTTTLLRHYDTTARLHYCDLIIRVHTPKVQFDNTHSATHAPHR